MNKLEDLNVEKEILPLFDFSLNMFTRNKIHEILKTPLRSTNAIIERQNIFKGFSENQQILKDYSYTVLYLNEVHFFLNEERIEDLSQKKIKYKFFTSTQEKNRYLSRLNQLILFFHRLESKYFSRLDLGSFPEGYRSDLKRILQFLENFQSSQYEQLIRENRLRDKHIIKLTQKINELKAKNLMPGFWTDLFLFEAYLSIHTGIERHNFRFPKVVNHNIKLKEFYHPLLINPVKNDFETTSNVIVLNGPNMSGKSTFLKAVGLCIYLGHLGMGVPATSAEIPFCDYFSIGINRRDDILNGYSHFMTEVMNLKTVVKTAAEGKKCFVVFDELFSGTNVEDAAEICRTTIKGLSKYENSYFFISTHIKELNSLAANNVSTYFLDCDLLDEKPRFTYLIKKGWSDIKVGRILFEKEGLNQMLK